MRGMTLRSRWYSSTCKHSANLKAALIHIEWSCTEGAAFSNLENIPKKHLKRIKLGHIPMSLVNISAFEVSDIFSIHRLVLGRPMQR